MRAALASLMLLCGAAHATQWEYDTSVDPMTSKKTVVATMVSDNNLDLKFPYGGKNYGQVTVRQKPGDGPDVLVIIAKGQIICNIYQCDLQVRFDDDKPIEFAGDKPADHSSNAVFLRSPAKFIARAKTAKKILVQFTAFQQGSQILEFGTPQSLSWPPK